MTEHRETVVVRESDSGFGSILGVLAIIVVLAIAWYLLLGPGAGTNSRPNDINVNVSVPSLAPQSS
jgi:hypothetical protein